VSIAPTFLLSSFAAARRATTRMDLCRMPGQPDSFLEPGYAQSGSDGVVHALLDLCASTPPIRVRTFDRERDSIAGALLALALRLERMLEFDLLASDHEGVPYVQAAATPEAAETRWMTDAQRFGPAFVENPLALAHHVCNVQSDLGRLAYASSRYSGAALEPYLTAAKRAALQSLYMGCLVRMSSHPRRTTPVQHLFIPLAAMLQARATAALVGPDYPFQTD
jgi:hypothetical protein